MPDEKRPLKVFLCHAHDDKPQVRELSQRLKSEGWIDPWIDEDKLTFGQHWSTAIESALDDADVVIIFLSKNSVQKEGFVQRELNYAWDISLEKPREVIFLIPFRLDECEVPRHLRSRQWGDYFGQKKDDTYNVLLRSLKIRHEQKLKLEAEELARSEKAAREKSEREAAERATRKKSEREAAQKAAREKAEREAAQKAAREKAEREAAEKVAREKAELETAEKAAREKAELEAAEKAAHEQAELEAAEKAVREKSEREAAEKAAREKTEREAAEKAAREKTEREAAEKAAREKAAREPDPQTPPRKLKTEYIVAIIGAAATLLAALIGVVPQFFKAAPAPTATSRPMLTATFTSLPPSQTPAPSLTPTQAFTPTPTPLPTEIVDDKGVTMRLVPAGEFTMGSNADDALTECQKYRTDCQRDWFLSEGPRRLVILVDFYMDMYEVTNTHYKACVEAKVCTPPALTSSYTRENYYGSPEFDNYPVITVTWEQAKTYCEKWRGARLPSEAEWEKAARGGLGGKHYPWGDVFEDGQANFCDTNCSFGWKSKTTICYRTSEIKGQS